MIKKIFKIIKKIVFSILIIYAYNSLALPLQILIPINVITILLVCFFDFFGLMGLILFKLFIF